MDRGFQSALDGDAALRAASEWFFELRSNDVSLERIADWQIWLAGDVTHRRAFERVESFWKLATQVNPTRWPSDSEVAADDYHGAESVSEWRTRTQRRGTRRMSPVFMACAAALAALAFFLGWTLFTGQRAMIVTTPIGETRAMTLADGSKVGIGAKTTLKITVTDRVRSIVLERGEAFFEVAKDASRPFIVQAGETSVTAVGTAFNVRRAGAGVIVAVAEGAVKVNGPSPARLDAGQQLTIENSKVATRVVPVDTRSVAGWREGRLQYSNEPLETIIADISRYSSRTIRLSDPDIRAMRVTGIIFQQNVDGWLASLQATFAVRVVHQSDGTVRLEPLRAPAEQ